MRTTEPQTIQTFQELRSFMQREQLTDKDRVNLWTLLQDAHASSTKEYEDTWLPYLTGFPHHFQQPLTRVYSEKEYSAPERSEATLIESPLSKKCASIEGETRPPMNLFGSLSPLDVSPSCCLDSKEHLHD